MLHSLLELKSLNLKRLVVLYSGYSAVLTGTSVRFNFGISLVRVEQFLNKERILVQKKRSGQQQV